MTTPRPALPVKVQIRYAFGIMGWSIMMNLISVLLVYLYLPPKDSGLPVLITQATIFGIFNAIALITAGGRFFDAVYDPLIAQASDRSRNPNGRRTPFMKWAIVPSIVTCCLVFYPWREAEAGINILWLVLMLVGFYVSTTTYIIPYNALLPQLAQDSDQKVKLASWQSAGYVFGIGVSANALNLSAWFQEHFSIPKIHALQYTVAIFALLAGICMAVPAFGIRERDYPRPQESDVTLRDALKQTLGNRNFQLFIVADFAYFMGVTIISSGLMYFVTVLLGLPETIGNKLMITMVLVSFVFYPVINKLARRIEKKIIVVVSLLLLAVVFAGVFFLGRVPFDHKTQIYVLIVLAAVPVASLNILPNAILAEVIDDDKERTGNNKEAFYFAVRYFFVKIAQTVAIALFAMLLIYGKDPGNDWGIRLNGIFGFALCTAAGLIFTRFKDMGRKA